MPLDATIKQLFNAIIRGDEEDSKVFAQEAINLGADPTNLIQESIQSALDVIGENFANGSVFLPELIMAGDAAQSALEFIIPTISEEKSKSVIKGTVVIGTPFGDNHDIGKNIVGAIVTARGFKVIDIGINVPPNKFVDEALKNDADIIAVSTLLTTSLPYQRDIVQLLVDRNERDKFFLLLGGGPVTPEWTREINADGYGWSANDAASLCLQLVEGSQKPPLSEPLIIGALKN